MALDEQRLRDTRTPPDLPFAIRKIGHVVLRVSDLARSVEFKDPDGHWLEICWGLDQIGTEGVVRPKEQWDWAHSLEEAIDRPVPGQNAALQDASLREAKKEQGS
jgi:hypothetical protein